MRLMRPLFALASATSLLVCVATAVLWVRSYRVSEKLEWDWDVRRPNSTDEHIFTIGSKRGRVMFGFDIVATAPTKPDPIKFWYADYLNPRGFTGNHYPPLTLGFDLAYGSYVAPMAGDQISYVAVMIPDYALILGFLLPPLLGWHRKTRRILHERCQKCGYDLRTTPDRCPECGTVPRPPKRTRSFWSWFPRHGRIQTGRL